MHKPTASKTQLLTIFLAMVVAGAAFSGCGFTNEKGLGGGGSVSGGPGTGGNQTTGGGGGTSSAATFSQVNSQILQAKCVSCHGSGASPDLSSYGSFATNTQWIVPGNPSSSTIYQAVQSGQMPQGGQPLTSDELNLLSSWIQNGAQND